MPPSHASVAVPFMHCIGAARQQTYINYITIREHRPPMLWAILVCWALFLDSTTERRCEVVVVGGGEVPIRDETVDQGLTIVHFSAQRKHTM